jgi:hypothetical protein
LIRLSRRDRGGIIIGGNRVKIERYWANAELTTKLEQLLPLEAAKIPGRSLPKRTVVRPNRWAAEPPGERPYGLRPYELKEKQALASAVETATLRLTDNQWLRDLRKHLQERSRESGAAFQDALRKHLTAAEYARGVRWAEIDGIEQYRRHEQLRWFIDGRARADESNVPYEVDTQIAGFSIEEVANDVAEDRRAKYMRPMRQRQSPGPKPKGERAMTGAERVRNHRDRKKSD